MKPISYKEKNPFRKISIFKNDKIIDKRINEFEQYVEDKLKEGNSSFISEDGDIEKWIGKVNKEKVKEYVSLVADRLNSFKK